MNEGLGLHLKLNGAIHERSGLGGVFKYHGREAEISHRLGGRLVGPTCKRATAPRSSAWGDPELGVKSRGLGFRQTVKAFLSPLSSYLIQTSSIGPAGGRGVSDSFNILYLVLCGSS